MEPKKFFVVNAATCDTRNVQESTLAAYTKTILNSALVLVSPASKALLDQYNVLVNAPQTLELDEDVQVLKINGRTEIKPGPAQPAGKQALVVNGTVDIAPGSEDLLSNYCVIQVNGSLSCPESIAGRLSMVKLNGAMETYPDGCIRLKRTAVLDRTFHLRARQDARYFAAKRIVALDPAIAFDKLTEKNIQFVTKSLLVAEGLAEAAIPLFDEQTDITILPDGCSYVDDSATLDAALLRRHGGKLYIDGSLTINKDSAPYLAQITFLHVNGDLLVSKTLVDAVGGIDAAYNALCVMGGTVLTDRIDVNVDRTMLEQAEDGLSLTDCVNVKIAKDVPPELLRERLISITDCVNVFCTGEQQGAVELVATDVDNIGGEDGSEDGGVKKPHGLNKVEDILNALFPGEALTPAERAEILLNSKVVNAADYTL